MKKVLLSILVIIAVFALSACRMGKDETQTTTQPNTTSPTTVNPTIIDPTIIDPTFETNIPDSNVDNDYLIDPTEDTTSKDVQRNHR
jgi:hypothetical protein